MELDKIAATLETTLARHLGWIAAADTKAGFVFAIDTAMLGLLVAAAPAYGKWTALGVFWTIPAVTLLLASLGCLTAAVFPRTKGPKTSLVYFGPAAKMTASEYAAAFASLDMQGYFDDLVAQCYVNARIAATKYAWVKRSAILLYVTLIPWAASIYVLFRDRQATGP